jgi:hypothetical protein
MQPSLFINNDLQIVRLKGMIKDRKAHFEFLGSCVSLVQLRNELSFVLRIDYEDYFKDNPFVANDEYKNKQFF